jgi:hypothetical protein
MMMASSKAPSWPMASSGITYLIAMLPNLLAPDVTFQPNTLDRFF